MTCCTERRWAALLLALALATPAAAREWRVAPGGAGGGTPDLQDVLARVRPGDVVTLAPGEYRVSLVTRVDGTAAAPITLRGPASAVLRSDGRRGRLFDLRHDYYHLEGFTLDGRHGAPDRRDGYVNKLLYVQGRRPAAGVRGLRVVGLTLRNAGGECLRIRHRASDIEVRDSDIHHCGLFDYRFGGGRQNGEGIYVGTSSRQWNDGRNPLPGPDTTHAVRLLGNRIATHGAECVDVKEGAHDVRIEGNRCSAVRDPRAGAINLRGDHNTVRGNHISDVAGFGVRLGGSRVAGRRYGLHNVVRDNRIERAAAGGLNVRAWPQDRICGNRFGLAVTPRWRGPARGIDPAAPCPPDQSSAGKR